MTLAASLLAGALAAAANAQLGEQTNTLEDADTATLRAPQREDWTQLAGAEYPSGELVENSPTPAEVDFFTTSFRDKLHGFAGGAACDGPGQDLETCTRVPAIYEYTQDELTGDAEWREQSRFEDEGYVAAIAWLGPDRALAVGGDGEYPRREPADGSDRAGAARAWLYEGGDWRELTREAGELPPGMSALTAFDYSTVSGFGIAGGLRQLWRWRDGVGFTPEEIVNPSLFRFRVRDVGFFDEVERPEFRRLFAVTSGCCTPPGEGGPALDSPSLLQYQATDENWRAYFLGLGSGSGLDHLGPRQSLTDSYYSFAYRPTRYTPKPIDAALSVILSPGGQLGNPEPASRILRYTPELWGQIGHATRNTDKVRPSEDIGIGTTNTQDKLISQSARLLAAGEDQAGENGSAAADGFPDWVVGVRRDPDQADEGRGIALATHIARPSINYDPPTSDPGSLPSYQPTDQEQLGAHRQPMRQLLRSYGLNAIETVGETGISWAVGDRGAIVTISESAALANEAQPDPPRLGARKTAKLGRRDAYEAQRPQPALWAGQVPALSDQPLEPLAEPRLVSHGIPNPHPPVGGEQLSALVMSRDGSEGWAIGGPDQAKAGTPKGPVLYHFDGESWLPCDPTSACAGLADAFDGFKQDLTLTAATRVPLEFDDNPTNDDEFEVLAVGSWYKNLTKPNPVLLRYRDGRWHAEIKDKTGPIKDGVLRGIALTAPDEGWLIGQETGNPVAYRLGDKGWVKCPGRPDAAVCDDPEGRLPITEAAMIEQWSVVTAGTRVYMAANRQGVRFPGVDLPRAVYPMIIARDSAQPCDEAGDEGCWHAEPGGDPGFGKYLLDTLPPPPEHAVAAAGDETTERRAQGRVFSISVTQRPDGNYEGWAVGAFGGPGGRKRLAAPPWFGDLGEHPGFPDATLLHLEDGRWSQWREDDAANDYLRAEPPASRQQLSLPGTSGASPTFITPPKAPAISFDGERWRVLEAPYQPRGLPGSEGHFEALAPDGQGGFWAAIQRTELKVPRGLAFYHYTDHAPEPVFEEAPQPLDGPLVALAGGAEGSVWAANRTAELARYDRVTGWEDVEIPGWDPGRVVTRRSRLNALAVGPDGNGVAVGEGGRIAQIGPDGVQLDPAAGTVCDLGALTPPCGTSHTLRAAAVAPDGSAMIGGDRLSLLWRPADGDFQAIARPEASIGSVVTGLALPRPDRAWLTTDRGLLFAGSLADGGWSWRQENGDATSTLGSEAGAPAVSLRAIALDAAGRGYAVGDGGLVLERTGDGPEPWRVVDAGPREDLLSVALSPSGAEAALIGGKDGLVWTRTGDAFKPARPADPTVGASGDVTGVALLPGYADGEVEAWAAISHPYNEGALLHYASDPDEPLLDPRSRATPLQDAPAPRPNELTIATFGKSDCSGGASYKCPDMSGTEATNELISRRVVEELRERAGGGGGPDLALFTGDAVDSSGDLSTSLGAGPAGLRRWTEMVADPLRAAGVPVLGAIGGQDLSELGYCVQEVGCVKTKAYAEAGVNFPWRRAMASQPGGWGTKEEIATAGLTVSPVEPEDPPGYVPNDDVEVDPDGAGPLGAERVGPGTGAARTHYAADVETPEGEKVARVVVVDTSLQSLAASDPVQNPLEADGGQQAWLQQMLCIRGGVGTGEGCTREPSQQAIVVSNTPTYSYGPGAGSETQGDATTFESILIENRANLVVSGRLGWNGRYWATAPGVHEPCPGGEYQDEAPEPGTRICGRSPDAVPVDPENPGATASSPVALPGTGAAQTGVLPFVIASSAGGKLASESDAEGLWHGYTIVRLESSGNPRETIVEQRPIFNWLSITAPDRTVSPRRKLTLRGVGREPLGVDGGGRVDHIDSPAITHRYDLLLADPQQPWLACRAEDPACNALYAGLSGGGEDEAAAVENPCAPYLCLPERIATVDRSSGEVRAGNGRYPNTFAVAMLSVGERSATYPLVFEKSPSFVVKSALRTSPMPPIDNVPSPRPPGQPPIPELPNIPTIEVPAIPAPPAIPSLTAASPPEPQPPVPPAPPPPTSQPAPLDVSVSPPALTVATPAAVVQPPTPPVNPAPPSGARREARQRQAAAQKSGAERDEEGNAGNAIDTGDLANEPMAPQGAPMTRLQSDATRRDRSRPEASFTPLARAEQASAWSRGALYGGGIALTAALLAIGFTTVRPRPRAGSPAPAHGRASRR